MHQSIRGLVFAFPQCPGVFHFYAVVDIEIFPGQFQIGNDILVDHLKVINRFDLLDMIIAVGELDLYTIIRFLIQQQQTSSPIVSYLITQWLHGFILVISDAFRADDTAVADAPAYALRPDAVKHRPIPAIVFINPIPAFFALDGVLSLGKVLANGVVLVRFISLAFFSILGQNKHQVGVSAVGSLCATFELIGEIRIAPFISVSAG